jgi:hypothetical protein
MLKEKFITFYIGLFCILYSVIQTNTFAQKNPGTEGLFNQLTQPLDYVSKRVSSYDRTGGNNDRYRINKGETVTFADIKGPGIITHFWNTIMPEPFCSAKAILRVYWDDEKYPSIEAPIGDFYCMGFGIDKNINSLPVTVSSEGRARNCYWLMPFKKSAKFTITNEGEIDIVSFYFNIDYRELKSLTDPVLYFHAQYRQEMPCTSKDNYPIVEAKGGGQYVGVSMNVLQSESAWWGEGDEMIYVDGEEKPSINGTGSEDYFCDAWGLYESQSMFYGCPLSENDYDNGSKFSVYRFHIPDPVPFQKSIRVTMEHGTNNNRSDYFTSVGYWYQTEPHVPFPPLPKLSERIPYAITFPNYKNGKWSKSQDNNLTKYSDAVSGNSIIAKKISLKKSRYYNFDGSRYNEFTVLQPGNPGEVILNINNPNSDLYDLVMICKTSNASGIYEIIKDNKKLGEINYYNEKEIFKIDTLIEIPFYEGENKIILKPLGKAEQSKGNNINIVYFYLLPKRLFVPEWNIAGPFDCATLDDIEKVFPPEEKIDLKQTYKNPDGKLIKWEKLKTNPDGYLDFYTHYGEINHGLAYAVSYVYSPDECKTKILFGSDDGSKIWVNDDLIHENPVYQWSHADQETININMKKGWNKILLKISQSYGWWGFHFRLLDAERRFKYTTDIK